ncbi:hypothetical protein RRG08_014881 [Elysia crispata]|uniref:Uncharacterized protein n=1 Tax=Elysia crispata TaxID=231223 RepID=A0AAE1E1E4_9GAST|nr:hypothetical protein RRG08_014881 [Elysia crispata]
MGSGEDMCVCVCVVVSTSLRGCCDVYLSTPPLPTSLFFVSFLSPFILLFPPPSSLSPSYPHLSSSSHLPLLCLLPIPIYPPLPTSLFFVSFLSPFILLFPPPSSLSPSYPHLSCSSHLPLLCLLPIPIYPALTPLPTSLFFVSFLSPFILLFPPPSSLSPSYPHLSCSYPSSHLPLLCLLPIPIYPALTPLPTSLFFVSFLSPFILLLPLFPPPSSLSPSYPHLSCSYPSSHLPLLCLLPIPIYPALTPLPTSLFFVSFLSPFILLLPLPPPPSSLSPS